MKLDLGDSVPMWYYTSVWLREAMDSYVNSTTSWHTSLEAKGELSPLLAAFSRTDPGLLGYLGLSILGELK